VNFTFLSKTAFAFHIHSSSPAPAVMEPMDMDIVRTTQTKKRKLNPVAPKIPKSIKTYVKKAIIKDAEMKFFDTLANNTASSTTFYGLDLLAIPQGTSENNRIGDAIRVHKVKWNLEVQPGDSYNTCRFVWSANQTRTQVSTSSLVGALRISGPSDNAEPIWMDKFITPKYVAADGSTTATSMVPIVIQGERKVNWVVRYPSAGTQNPMNRNFFFQLHSDSIAPPNPGIYGYVRVYFTDA